jgi:ribosome-associated protein
VTEGEEGHRDGAEDDPSSAVEPPSKSELKRRALAQQKLVDELLEMSDGELRRLDVTEATLTDLRQIRQMKPSHARNRSIKHLASRLLDNEREAASAYLENRKTRQADENRRFHQMEQWRDRLIEEGDAALGDLCNEYPQLDRQHLRTLIRTAQKERLTGKSVGAARKIFQEIRVLLS